MTWTLYHIPPMDAGWDLLGSVRDARDKILQNEFCREDDAPCDQEMCAFDAVLDAALDAALGEARRMGWRGDFSVGPRLFWLPCDSVPIYGFVWKAQDNGSTYVASPIALDNLRRVCLNYGGFTARKAGAGQTDILRPPSRRRASAEQPQDKSGASAPDVPSTDAPVTDSRATDSRVRPGVIAETLSAYERLYGAAKAVRPSMRPKSPTAQGMKDLESIARRVANPKENDKSLLFLLSLRQFVVMRGELTAAQRACVEPADARRLACFAGPPLRT